MEDAARYADEIFIMHQGSIYKKGTPLDIFSQPEQLTAVALDVPETVRFQWLLQQNSQFRFDSPYLDIDTLVSEIADKLKRGSTP